ncbi:MAG: hypothetical protein HQK76_05795 [Desulfobacterales bacterium]|nr:hypothetical protein [Desulfobacterales bacterium]
MILQLNKNFTLKGKYLMIRVLLIICGMSLIVLYDLVCFGDDFMDESFGIFSKDEQKSIRDFDIDAEFRKADNVSLNDAIAICQKLLKRTDLTQIDRQSIEKKIAGYNASIVQQEEEARRAQTGALLEKKAARPVISSVSILRLDKECHV